MLVSVEKPGSPKEVLEHVGVKGMRWGVRKERETSDRQPASRKERRIARRERRAEKHEATANRAQTEIDKIKATPSKWGFVQRGRNETVRELEKHRDTHLKAAKDLRADRMTDFQKKAIIGASITAAVLVAYGSYKMADSGTAHQLLNRNVPLKPNELLSRKMSPDSIMKEVVKPINPGYGSEMGTSMNCRRATFAYEMRRRGMDVRATKSVSGTGQTVAGMLNATDPKADFKTGKISMLGNLTKEGIAESKGAPRGPLTAAAKMAGGMGKEPIGKWAGFEKGSLERSKTIFEAIGEHPEGARGELGMRWYSGGAHSMAWEKINGKVHIFDAQSGKRYNVDSFASDVTSNIGEVGMTRLDNLELNQNYLRRWVTNVK
jgi:hypothetical protein